MTALTRGGRWVDRLVHVDPLDDPASGLWRYPITKLSPSRSTAADMLADRGKVTPQVRLAAWRQAHGIRATWAKHIAHVAVARALPAVADGAHPAARRRPYGVEGWKGLYGRAARPRLRSQDRRAKPGGGGAGRQLQLGVRRDGRAGRNRHPRRSPGAGGSRRGPRGTDRSLGLRTREGASPEPSRALRRGLRRTQPRRQLELRDDRARC